MGGAREEGPSGGRDDGRQRVVIVGGGFGGLACAQALRHADCEVTLIDRTNHHLFQPLLYQVAIAGLSPAEIASPIRSILRSQKNLRVLLGEVTAADLNAHTLTLDGGADVVPFDTLVIAVGAKTSYFGHDEWENVAPGLKSLEDAVEIRRRVLVAFERAERVHDDAERARLLTFVVIGGGPTGVELAGSIAELARTVLARDFRSIHPEKSNVVLVEAGDRILSAFDPKLSTRAKEQLGQLGVTVRTGLRVSGIDETGVAIEGGEHIAARTVLWGAGVRATRLCGQLGVPTDKMGRIVVGRDCAPEGHDGVFVIGDAAHMEIDGQVLPGLSPVAMQQGDYVARIIEQRIPKSEREPFTYFDKGTMATIGRSRAIAQVGKMRLTGFLAWLAWLFIHLIMLVGYRNRIVVLFEWAWSYVFYRRGARLITSRLPRHDDADESVRGALPQAKKPDDAAHSGAVVTSAKSDAGTGVVA
jgi:NADH dehydrogenase